MKMKIVHV